MVEAFRSLDHPEILGRGKIVVRHAILDFDTYSGLDGFFNASTGEAKWLARSFPS